MQLLEVGLCRASFGQSVARECVLKELLHGTMYVGLRVRTVKIFVPCADEFPQDALRWGEFAVDNP
jgi:hypothetical protein